MPFEPAVVLAGLGYVGLVLLPGLALLALIERGPAEARDAGWLADPAVRLGVALGLGLALQPLIYLWAHLIGLPLGRGVWAAYLAASVAIVAGSAWRHRPWRARTWLDAPRLTLGAILCLVLASRWWAARDLVVPSWGDSLHHTLIVRLFTLNGGLVDNWLPFAPLSTFTYHFGFHAGVASLAMLGGIEEARAVIVAGQILMVLQVLTAYALVAGLTGRPWAGVGAALAAAGLSTMPAYYANWGRYTQLAGQVILPVALLATLRGRLVAAILVAGLALTHYIITLMFALGCLAWLIAGVGGWDRAGARARLRLGGRMALIALAGGLLALPWLPQLAAGPLGATALALTTKRVGDPQVYGVVSPWQTWNQATLGLFVGWGLVVAVGVALGWGLFRRERIVIFGAVWIGLLVAASYPWLFGLPGTGVLKDAVVALGLYLPGGVIIGAALGDWLAGPLPPARPPNGWGRGLAIAITLLAVGLAWRDRDVVTPDTSYVRPADSAALEWIRANTPPDAVFLAGSGPAFGGTVEAGDDAGWWLPLLAEPRRGTVPPITYGIEHGFDPDYRLKVNRLAELVRSDLDGQATRAALAAAGVTHAYAGATGKALDRSKLAASPHWAVLYDAGGVQVFRFRDADRSRSDGEGMSSDLTSSVGRRARPSLVASLPR